MTDLHARFTSLALPVAIIVLWVSAWSQSAVAAGKDTYRKGNYLYTETERTEDAMSYRMTFTATPDTSYPVLKFTKTVIRTYHEVKVYETVCDYVEVQDSNGIPKESTRAMVVPNDFIRDNRSTRQEVFPAGPFANAVFELDGRNVTTDSQGLVSDTKQLLLEKFDDLSTNTQEIVVKHAKYGTQKINLTRYIVAPEELIVPDYKKQDSSATLDVLEGFALENKHSERAGRTSLEFSVSFPEEISPGEIFPMTMTVTNTGSFVSGNLIFSSFSREDWLDGKLFYFGNLAPGQTRSFTRLFATPSTLKSHASFVHFSSWDAVRAQPERGKTFKLPHANR